MNDGGPAFPTEHVNTGYEYQPYRPDPGMSLRDWLAGRVITGAWNIGPPEYSARRAYEIADAMLKEREK